MRFWNMRLLSLQIKGFKRFEDATTLRVRGRTLAILGHNESGKTSLLEALEHLGSNSFPGATQFTDRQQRPSSDVILSARFAVEADDLSAIADDLDGRSYTGSIPSDARWTLLKWANGERRFSYDSGLRRDVAPRTALAQEVRRVLQTEWDDIPAGDYNDERLAELYTIASGVGDKLYDEREEGLAKASLDSLSDLHTQLTSWAEQLPEPSDSLDGLREHVGALLAEETAPLPDLVAGRALFARQPAFLRFDGDARTLPPFTAFVERPSSSLVNLLAAADARFEDLANLAGSEDSRTILSEEEARINLRLEALFRAWTQKNVILAVRIDANGIEVRARDRAAPLIDTPLQQRSSGMRMFAALLAFLHVHDDGWTSPPVLLVDEAEMHLHYDGQADLVRVFERQAVAQVVLYTTHSIGCLPEDLGLGLIVVEEHGDERSRLSQSFWTRGPGLTPLMTALGAGAASFTPARRAVIGEGAHEAILLPSLLRQARDNEDTLAPLGFQVVGGLAQISSEAAAGLEEDAGTVVYLLDNDQEGMAIRSILPEQARENGRVLVLGQGTDLVSIEDLLAAEVLVASIDEVLKADGHQPLGLEPQAVPTTGRAAWAVAQMINGGGHDARTRLAQAAVLSAPEAGLIEPSRIQILKDLLVTIRELFPARDALDEG
jgi:energy-coupling factor transporter ATP-binding protein EcfA2